MSFLVEGLRVETRGLRALGHPELALQAVEVSQLPAARACLTTLAAAVLLGRRIAAGDELEEGGVRCCFVVAALQLWEEDAAGVFSPSCPLLLSALAGGE